MPQTERWMTQAQAEALRKRVNEIAKGWENWTTDGCMAGLAAYDLAICEATLRPVHTDDYAAHDALERCAGGNPPRGYSHVHSLVGIHSVHIYEGLGYQDYYGEGPTLAAAAGAALDAWAKEGK